MTAPLPEEVEALALKALEKEAGKRLTVAKALLGKRYPDGHRETFRSPVDDSKIGLVYRTDPDPVWRITDSEELDRFLTDEDLGNVEVIYEITADYADLVPLLLEHAPHLVEQVKRVTQEARDRAVAAAKAGKEIPGIAKVKPGGVLTVTPDKNAAEAISGLVNAGLLTWDGRLVLEAGEAAS